MILRLRQAAAALAATLVLCGASHAQDNGPIRLIIGFPPGASTDVVGRIIAATTEPVLGQKFVVENADGGSGTIAVNRLLTAPKNGTALMVGVNQINAINYSLMRNPGYQPGDFAPVIGVGGTSHVLTVLADFPAKSVKDLVELAKKRPGELNMGSGGTGSSGHLISELFRMRTGTNIVHIPYRGGGPMLAAFLGGQVHMSFGTETTLMPQVKTGKLRALAVSSPTRLSELPEVPTMVELGFPDVSCDNWFGVFAPAGTPAPAIDRLYKAMAAGLGTPAARTQLAQAGVLRELRDPARFNDYVNAEIAKYRELVAAIKLEPQN